MKQFRETIIRGFLQADATKLTALTVGHPIGIATVFILTLIKLAQGPGLSEWDKLEEKIKREVDASIDDNNIENLDDEVNRITYLMGKAKRNKFTKEDLQEIRAFAPNFFPQQYTAGKYTVRWNLLLSKYLAILSAGYIDMMKQQGKYGECAWSQQLTQLLPQILNVVKKMAKSRRQDLDRTNWHYSVALSFRDKPTGIYIIYFLNNDEILFTLE